MASQNARASQMSRESGDSPTWKSRPSVISQSSKSRKSVPTIGFYDYSNRGSQLSNEEDMDLRKSWEELRHKKGEALDTCLGRILFHPQFETCGGLVVLLNFVVMTMETHASATDDGKVLRFVALANRILLIYYTAELSLRVCVLKWTAFKTGWNVLDLVIVVTGWLSEFLEVFQVTQGMDQIAMLKTLRMLRLLRLVRLFIAFRELYVLVAGIGRCMKTLFWASGLICIVLNVWAILSVEFLDEKVRQLVPSGVYRNCGWCGTAFANIWYANLTWFQIISSSDWTTIGRPLAEEFSWTYAFFVLNVYIVIWGLLNLIVAAIVDANIAAREDDVAIAAKVAEHHYKQAWLSFEQICRDMDLDGSGDVSVKEFKLFLQQNVELQQHLQIMGIQEQDVNDLLTFMDGDGNGTLESDEFIEQFTTMRTLVEKTSIYFIMKYCQSIQGKLSDQNHLIQHMYSDIAALKSLAGMGDSIPNPAVSPRCSVTSNGVSVVATSAFSATSQTQRTTEQPEMPRADLKSYSQTSNGESLAAPSALRASAQKRRTAEQPEMPPVSMPNPAASSRYSQTSNGESFASPSALKASAQKRRTSEQAEMQPVDLKRLPFGWYYFGASLPPEASVWCKAMDMNCGIMTTSNFPGTPPDINDAKEAPVATNGQSWEQLTSNTIHVHHAKHIYVKAAIGDVQLPPEIIEALAAVDRFIDGIFSDRCSEEVPVATDGQRWESLPSNSIRIQSARHVYLKANIGDIQLPPEIIQSLASVDRFIDGIYSEPLAAIDGPASERDPVDDVLNAIDNDDNFLS